MTELDMVKVRSYGRLVMAGRRTIDKVPEVYREAVQKWIAEQG